MAICHVTGGECMRNCDTAVGVNKCRLLSATDFFDDSLTKQPAALYVDRETPRQQLLQEAMKITAEDRNKAYGSPEDNFTNIADYWMLYLNQRFPGKLLELLPSDVAYMMILMKMARLATNITHRDSLVDIAGYAACGADYQVALAGRSQDAMSLRDAMNINVTQPKKV